MPLTLQIQCHYPNMVLPKRSLESDIGIDLTALSVIQKSEFLFLVDTGISVKPPAGYYVEVVPRSSMSNTNFILANSVGIIDPDYRGHIFCAFKYIGKESTVLAAQEIQSLIGTRVAQMLLKKSEWCITEQVESLESTERGTGGFGSTGK